MNPQAIIIAAIIIALIYILLIRPKGGKSSTGQPPVPKSGWHPRFSEGVGDPTMQGAGWSIDIPASPGHLNMMLNYDRQTLRVGQTLTAKCRVTGGPIQAQGQALVSLFIQRRGDDIYGGPKFYGYRLASVKAVPLVEGEFELPVTLTADQFYDVQGGKNADAFAAALADMESFGFSFGQEAGRAHGVSAGQAARFELVSLS